MRGVQTTNLVLSAAGILLASATMAKSLSHAGSLRSKVRRAFIFANPGYHANSFNLQKQNIITWVAILIIAALGTTLTELGGYIETSFTYWDAVFTTESELQEYYDKRHAVYFLTAFFYSLAFYAALRVASHQVVPGHPTRVMANSPPEYAPQPTAAMNEYHAPVDQRFSTGNQSQGYFQSQTRDQTLCSQDQRHHHRRHLLRQVRNGHGHVSDKACGARQDASATAGHSSTARDLAAPKRPFHPAG